MSCQKGTYNFQECARRAHKIFESGHLWEYAQRIVDCEHVIRHKTETFFNIDFVRMRGFSQYPNHEIMDVAYYSDNGIYPGSDYSTYGFTKYHQNMKRALHDAVGKWATGRRSNLY